MIIGPRYKIAKRLGGSVFEKTQTPKFMLSAERRQRIRRGKRPKSFSDYGRQLIEKQRVRFTYGITEKQLTRYVKMATERRGTETIGELYRTLEMRLDNVVARLGLAPTRRMARQMVSHGHITVNGKRVTIPSYQTSVGEVISLRAGSRQGPFFETLKERLKSVNAPSWLSLNGDAIEGTVTGIPKAGAGEGTFNLATVMEFYSR